MTGGAIVVVMAKRPLPGRTKTRLSPPLSPARAAELYAALLDDTLVLVSRVRGLRLAVAITSPDAIDAWRPDRIGDAIVLPVGGPDIGVCLRDATAQLFARGFSPVIALNSDGPTLPPARIEQARALLDDHDVVIGPGEDGGYYLLGVRQPRPELFRDIAWSTSRVAAQTLDRAAALRLSVGVLPPWHDVDTAADLERLRAELDSIPRDMLACTRRFFAREAPGGGEAVPSDKDITA